MLSSEIGPWGLVAGAVVLFFGLFNWLFEPSYSSIPRLPDKKRSHN